jgi:hypothetical protein
VNFFKKIGVGQVWTTGPLDTEWPTSETGMDKKIKGDTRETGSKSTTNKASDTDSYPNL